MVLGTNKNTNHVNYNMEILHIIRDDEQDADSSTTGEAYSYLWFVSSLIWNTIAANQTLQSWNAKIIPVLKQWRKQGHQLILFTSEASSRIFVTPKKLLKHLSLVKFDMIFVMCQTSQWICKQRVFDITSERLMWFGRSWEDVIKYLW